MDPTTIAIAATLASTAIQTIQQYTSGVITQDEAHQQLIDASSTLSQAIDAFNAAKPST